MRKEYIKKLEVYSKELLLDISDGKDELSLSYLSDVKNDGLKREEIEEEYKRVFNRELEREKRAGMTLFGPHRDDIEININGSNSRFFASQGQQRSIVLAIKLGEGEVSRDINGEYPVFLFDDVLSELDEKRRKYILTASGERQIIITSCDKDKTEFEGCHKTEVKNGVYKETEG